ncbi:MAG TPA: hypothetical protein VF647_13890 [Longimicrobium sp.]|jgi:hypothetical protein
MSKSREWVYWPARLEYAAPWLIGPSLFILLGALGFSSRYIDTVSQTPRPVSKSILFIVLGTALSFILLLTHARTAYVTFRQSVRPVFFTTILLSVAYGALWSSLLVVNGSLACALCDASQIDIPTTLHVSATAVQILASVLLVSALWKTEDLSLGKVQKLRDVALAHLPKVVKGNASQDEYQRVLETLAAIPAAAGEIGLVTPREQSLVADWTSAAEELAADLGGWTPREIPENIPSRVAANLLRLARS